MCWLWRAKHNNIDNSSTEDVLFGFMWRTRDLSLSSIVFKCFFFPFQMMPEIKFNQALVLSPRKERFVFEMICWYWGTGMVWPWIASYKGVSNQKGPDKAIWQREISIKSKCKQFRLRVRQWAEGSWLVIQISSWLKRDW